MFVSNPFRKKMFVSGRIQGRLMVRIGLYWVLYHVVLWHALFVYRYLQYRMSGAATYSAVPFSELYGQFVIDYYPVILCAVVTLPIVLIDMMHLTHHIAGPLVRFQNALRDLIAGKEIEHVSLRKGDLLTEFQDEFNRYLAELAGRRQTTAGGKNSEAMAETEAEILAQVADLQTSIASAHATAENELCPTVPADVPQS